MFEGDEEQLYNRAISKCKGAIKNPLNILTLNILKLIGNARQYLNLQEHTQRQFRDNIKNNKIVILLRSRLDDKFDLL